MTMPLSPSQYVMSICPIASFEDDPYVKGRTNWDASEAWKISRKDNELFWFYFHPIIAFSLRKSAVTDQAHI